MKSLLLPIAIVWILLIVGLSTSIGDWQHSHQIILGVVEQVNPDFAQRLTPKDMETANFILRKCAHFSEYAILFSLTYWVSRSRFKLTPKIALPFVLAGVILFAVSDEFHQSFVPGRTPNARDVLIDSLGASAVALLCLKFDTPAENNSSRNSL